MSSLNSPCAILYGMSSEQNPGNVFKEYIGIDYVLWPVRYELVRTLYGQNKRSSTFRAPVGWSEPELLRVLFRPDIFSTTHPIVQVGRRRAEGHLVVTNGHASDGEHSIPMLFVSVNVDLGIPMIIDLFALQQGSLSSPARIIAPQLLKNHEYALTPLNRLYQRNEFNRAVRALLEGLKRNP